MAGGGIWGEEERGILSAWENKTKQNTPKKNPNETRRERVGVHTNVQSQRQEMVQLRDGAEMGLQRCWCRCLDQPKVGRGEAGAIAYPEQGQILWFCWRWDHACSVSAPPRWQHRPSGVPWAHSGSPCLQAAGAGHLGRMRGGFQLQTQSVGELGLLPVKLKIAHMEGRARSAGCVLVERFLPAVPPTAPTSPPLGTGLGQEGFFCGSSENPYFGQAHRCRAGAWSFHLQPLSVFATRSVQCRHPRCYHLEQLTAGAELY